DVECDIVADKSFAIVDRGPHALKGDTDRLYLIIRGTERRKSGSGRLYNPAQLDEVRSKFVIQLFKRMPCQHVRIQQVPGAAGLHLRSGAAAGDHKPFSREDLESLANSLTAYTEFFGQFCLSRQKVSLPDFP